MKRRGFLKGLGAAFCGAMLYTFPDFAPRRELGIRFAGRKGYGEPIPYQTLRFGVDGGNIVPEGFAIDFPEEELRNTLERFRSFGRS